MIAGIGSRRGLWLLLVAVVFLSLPSGIDGFNALRTSGVRQLASQKAWTAQPAPASGVRSALPSRVQAGARERTGIRTSVNMSLVAPDAGKEPVAASDLADRNSVKGKTPPKVLLATALLAVAAVYVGSGQTSLGSIDVQGYMKQAVTRIENAGPMGYVYFALVYTVAEILAIPVFPLTASSGYLFGLGPGTAIVLVSATIAACISFSIGRTVLRQWAKGITDKWPKWHAIDAAVSKEGFKVILLLRLSPLLPFALSNYLYGLTSVDFGSFALATLLGFAPGTLGIVYAGSAGHAVFGGPGSGSMPWYVLAGAGAAILFAGQTVGKIATDAIKKIEDEDKEEEKKKQQLEGRDAP